MPLSELDEFQAQIPKHKKVIIHCETGVRSEAAINRLEKQYGFTNLYNLKGGIKGVFVQISLLANALQDIFIFDGKIL